MSDHGEPHLAERGRGRHVLGHERSVPSAVYTSVEPIGCLHMQTRSVGAAVGGMWSLEAFHLWRWNVIHSSLRLNWIRIFILLKHFKEERLRF